MRQLSDFSEYLEIESQNLERAVAILGEDYRFVSDLDNLYGTCVNIPLPDNPDLMIPAFLFLISHQEYYCSVASFMRLHKTGSFRCLRAALDSTFTAYYLLKNPDRTESYVHKGEDPSTWDYLFRNIKATIKNNKKIFPLATGLPEVHDLCSKFAHADPEGIFHKYLMDKKELKLQVQYFDYDDTPGDFKRWYTFFIHNFFKIFLIYWHEMLKKEAGKLKKDINNLVKEYKSNITDLRKHYPLL